MFETISYFMTAFSWLSKWIIQIYEPASLALEAAYCSWRDNSNANITKLCLAERIDEAEIDGESESRL